MPNLLRKLILIILLTLISAAVMAETEKWYTVEVISFTRNASDRTAERWSELPTQEDAGSGLSSLEGIVDVPKEQWQLGPHAYSVNRAPEMSVASHQAWRQKGLSRSQAPWIPLNSRSNSLNGKIKISLSRFLHADVDINLENPDRYSSSDFMAASEVQFKTSKKVRRDKLFYIDHPLAGVLILIERYQPET
jgi:hypothetical protein